MELLGRLRSRPGDAVAGAAARGAASRPAPQARRGAGPFRSGDLAAPQVTTSTVTSRYGTAVTAAWDRVHPRLTHRAAWLDHDGELPVIEGTLIRLTSGSPAR